MSSYYEDERRRYRPDRDRVRQDSYDDETVYNTRGNARSSALVKRRDSYDSADDEVTREFPPPEGRGGYYRETTIRKSGTRPSRTRSFEDDRYYDDRYQDDRSYAGGRRSSKYYDDRRDRRSRRYSSDYSSRSRSRTPPRRDRRKSQPEQALEALGLGGLAATLLGKKERSRSRSRDRDARRSGRDRAYSEDRYSTRKRSKSRGTGTEQLTQALKAAVLAGAGEAFRARKEPGGWSGEKGKRVLTAAFSAGGVDGLISHNKDPKDHSTRNAIGSAIAGIATSRIVNGPRSKSRGRGGSPDSTRGRSQSRGGLGDLAAGGVVAAAAKKAYDNVRGQSRGRQRSRSTSYSSDSRSPSHTSRRRSVSRAAAKGLAAVGLTSAADKVDPDRRRSRRNSDDYNDRVGGNGYNDYRDDAVGQPRSGSVNGRARSVSHPRSDWHVAERTEHPSGYTLDYGPRHTGDPETDSNSDLGSSTDEEREHKRGKRKQLLTAGLATVATIHAGHSVYQSYEKRSTRKRAVREGKISAEQAKENKNRDRLQDAASVGLAALGIKGAYSEWKEMKEKKEEVEQEAERSERHRLKRAARRRKYRKVGGVPYADGGDGFTNSMPNLHSPQPVSAPPYAGYFPNQYTPQYRGEGPYSATVPIQPMYYDDNPYHMAIPSYPPGPPPIPQMSEQHLPPPPVGHPQQTYPAPPPSTASPRHVQDPVSQPQPQFEPQYQAQPQLQPQDQPPVPAQPQQ